MSGRGGGKVEEGYQFLNYQNKKSLHSQAVCQRILTDNRISYLLGEKQQNKKRTIDCTAYYSGRKREFGILIFFFIFHCQKVKMLFTK